MLQYHRILSAACLLLLATAASAFTTPQQQRQHRITLAPLPKLASSTSCKLNSSIRHANTHLSAANNNVLVISPPGGIGEITSIESARLGASVKWFVISAPPASKDALSLTSSTLAAIASAGGSLEFAGATADAILSPPNEDGSNSGGAALSAMSSWIDQPSTVICTYDGALDEKKRVDQSKTPEQLDANINEVEMIKSSLRVAVKEAMKSSVGRSCSKVAILPANEEIKSSNSEESEGEKKKGGGLFGALFGGNDIDIPVSMEEAMGGNVKVVMRHGELFGAPESSPESSPFMGGPRRDPVVRDMYTMRSVRIDPTISVSGNVLSGGEGSKSNRLAVGEAAARIGLGKLNVAKQNNLDVSLSSFAGTESPSDEEWNAEFDRVVENMMSSSSTSGARLFSAEFSSVPSTKRLAEWIATKWAPTILRSYDIAGTRVGARPVYALQTEDDVVEIVWQELVDFNSVTSGKMVIEVDDGGITAYRGAGDASRGFGAISNMPLPGEDILVRRLGDAASQAVEKGLAVKPQLKKTAPEPKKPVTTVVASSAPAAVAEASTATASSSGDGGAAAASSGRPGPRSAGARRSAQRTRGARRKASTPPKPSSGGES